MKIGQIVRKCGKFDKQRPESGELFSSWYIPR